MPNNGMQRTALRAAADAETVGLKSKMNENLWKTLGSINEWVRFSEGKAIALLAAQGVLIGVLSQNLLLDDFSLNAKESITVGLALAFNGGSMFFAFLCLNPRIKLKGGISPLFFGSIASSFKASNEYFDYYNEKMSNEESISKELCGQIFVNSQIANRKYRNVAYSIRLFFGSISAWMAFLIIRMM